MRAKQIQSLLQSAMVAKMPVLIKGAPGIGKSDIVAQAAAAAGFDLMISHPVVADPTDAKGLPWAEQGAQEAKFLPFGDLARAVRATKPLAWFLDDLGQATPSVQASFMQLLLAREVNGHKLPDCVTFVAATNRRIDRAGVTGILEPVKSRFATIVELDVNVDDWVQWAVAANVRPEVIAYIRLFPDHLHVHAPSGDMTNSPSPRTWNFVSRWLDAGIAKDIEFSTYAGSIGEPHAAQFVQFLATLRDAPSVDEILLDPEKAIVPEKSDLLCAVSTALANVANERNFDRVLTYLGRLPLDFGVLCVRDAKRRNPAVLKSKAWMNYVNGPIGRAVIGDAAV